MFQRLYIIWEEVLYSRWTAKQCDRKFKYTDKKSLKSEKGRIRCVIIIGVQLPTRKVETFKRVWQYRVCLAAICRYFVERAHPVRWGGSSPLLSHRIWSKLTHRKYNTDPTSRWNVWYKRTQADMYFVRIRIEYFVFKYCRWKSIAFSLRISTYVCARLI